jgi:hypothetical protein
MGPPVVHGLFGGEPLLEAHKRGAAGAARVGFAVVTVLLLWPLGVARADGPGGTPIVFGLRPTFDRELRACSFRLPACVHAPPKTPPRRVLDVLDSVERAWQAASWGLDLPTPDIDHSTGAFDVYIEETVGGARAELSERDPLSSFDRASAFVSVDPRLEGCALDTAVARETARAVLFRTAPATDPGTARAEAAYLARLMAPCALEAPGDVDAFQAHAEASVTGVLRGGLADELPGSPTAYADGASLFYWWLDYAFGNSPGGVVRALWALAPTRTALGAGVWSNRPTGFDVLRESFKGALTTGSTMDDLYLDFAVARAFVGASSDDLHMPETRALGEAGRPRLAWAVDWPTAPRTLASGRGVEPTGAAYVGVDCRSAPAGSRLRVEVEWEEHAKMRWVAVKLDAADHESGQVPLPANDRATLAQVTVVDLDGVARVLLVGTNTGDPFTTDDPGNETPEPHGWQISVAAEPP